MILFMLNTMWKIYIELKQMEKGEAKLKKRFASEHDEFGLQRKTMVVIDYLKPFNGKSRQALWQLLW